MKHLTMIVRCDQGGLAQQTHELWRRLKPDTTVVVHVTPSRGAESPDRFPGAVHVRHEALTPQLLEALTPEGGTILSAETFYTASHRISGRRRVLIANPELYDSSYAADLLITPTPWELDRMPAGTVYLPHPQAPAPLSHVRVRTECKTFLHMAAPAMLDRNGSQVVLQAVELMKEKATLILRAPQVPTKSRAGNVIIEWDPSAADEWYECYSTEADAFVIPRRYGGLCLPAQEAAACGLPLVMPNLSPQTEWPGVRFQPTTPGRNNRLHNMKGGRFTVYNPDPRHLAEKMDEMVRGEFDIQGESWEALRWADSLDWMSISPLWEQALDAG